MRTLVIATNNQNKVKEIQKLLDSSILLKTLKDIGCDEELPENQDTLEGNALEKAQYVADHYGVDCFADDTGLLVDALSGAPGVYTARYAGPQRDANDNMNLLIKNLQSESNRKARFVTVMALVENGESKTFEGVCEGAISLKMSGAKGFGYDPVFIPEGYDVTFAEMELSEKNKISHRGRAVQKLVAYLNQ